MILARIMRAGIAILLLIILAVIMRYFIARSLREHQTSMKTKKITQQKIEKKEKIEHFEIKGEEESVKVRADEHYVGEDDKNYVEGNVEIIFLKRREGKDVFLYGDEVVYDKDWNHVLLSGQARAKFKDLMIESASLHYDNKKELFSTESGVNFSSRRLRGPAQKMVYLMEEEKLELEGNIRLQIEPNIETSSPIEVRGNKFEYSEKRKRGKMEGEVRLFHGKSRASADILEFELFPDGENIRTLILKGKVKASLIEEEKREVSSQSEPSNFAQGTKREVEAEEIELRAFPKLQKIQAMEAKGNCSFKFVSSSGSFTQILAESMRFLFDPEGELRELHALKNARMLDQGENPEDRRLTAGDTLTIKDKTDVLRVKGKGKFGARVASSDSDIFAEEIVVFLDNNNLEAKGGVKVVLKSKKGEKKRIGLFSKERPVFIRAKEMRYFDEQNRFLFDEDIKVWQEKKVLFADKVMLDEETGKIFCTGGVKSIFPHRPKEEKEEERLEISSDIMTFKPEENVISYEKRCSLKVKEIDLRAQSVSIYLGEEKGDMERMIARGKVVIVQNLGEGRGEEAIYDPDKESLILLGNPVLIDKEKGITNGDKLTFYIADDRILVENKDRERSATIIKREE